ncbi:hypothetical protein CWI36_0084p0030 [Hamiltosporidium magnivora]|uniref:Leucine-rich repeat-containing protein n=1 Tax=Hamiltosporidium magnivora TaxID=148818 RepID=A0A4Q9LL14_9MICR|nr:hypothetical protein CWI36_0084p0030 [Hamiltosporidium magnivora]
MYSLISLQFFSIFFAKNIEYLCLKIQRWIMRYWALFAFLYSLSFLKEINCACQSNNGIIEFALIDINWRKSIGREIIAKVEYWLSRSNENDRFSFCSGKHQFTANRIYPAFFVCPHSRSFLNHEPLHIYRVNYKDDWKVKFRVLNDYLSKNSGKPFLFYGSFDVSYQLLGVFAGYISNDSIVLSENLSYELFYKLIKVLDLLDPISCENLDKFYLALYKNGLINSISSADILNDFCDYKTRLFSEQGLQTSFLGFFSVLNDSLDACLIPNISTLSLFQKKGQYIDRCFRYAKNIQRLVLKISACSLELLMSALDDKMRIFNWLLTVTKIEGFYFDDTENTYNPIKCQNVCGFIRPEIPIRSSNLLKAVPPEFFLNLSEANQQRITYLRFVNIDICFATFQTIFEKNKVSFLEAAYCSSVECQEITKFLVKMPDLNIFKLRDMEMRSDDVNRILFSKIRVLVLDTCTICNDSVWSLEKNYIFKYEIIEHLRTLSVLSSRLPVDLIQLLLRSMNLENLNISNFEFLPANSSFSVVAFQGKWNYLQVDKYFPTDYLKSFLRGFSVSFLSVCESRVFSDILFFFNTGYFSSSVKSLDLSDNSLTVDNMTLMNNFRNLQYLNLSASLPLNTDDLPNLRMFDTLRALDISRNNITSKNYDFISRFTVLESLSISESKIEKGTWINVFNDQLIASLVSLDLSGVDMYFSDFEKIRYCKRLKYLHFKVATDCFLFRYFNILGLADMKKNLNILSVETDGNICFDDLVRLAGFSNLSEVKIECNTFLPVGQEKFEKYDFFNPEFRLEMGLRHYNLDVNAKEILKEMFDNYSFSIVSH